MSFKVGDLVRCNQLDTGIITYIDEANNYADVEVELYDYTTSYHVPIEQLERFNIDRKQEEN